MNKIPFSLYDFFGYLSSGFLLLVAIDYALQLNLVFQGETIVTEYIFGVLVIYIFGHLVALPSKLILEDLIVKKILKSPSVNLFIDSQPWYKKVLFPQYYEPLSSHQIQTIYDYCAKKGLAFGGEELFRYVYPRIVNIQEAKEKLDSFLNMYGFARNISFTLLVSSLIIFVGNYYNSNHDYELWVWLALIGGIGMFYRYIKFYWSFSNKLFATWASQIDS